MKKMYQPVTMLITYIEAIDIVTTSDNGADFDADELWSGSGWQGGAQ